MAPDLQHRPRRAAARRDPRRQDLLVHRHRAVRGAEPRPRTSRALGGPRPPHPHRPRPRLPADVLGRPGRGAATRSSRALEHVTVAVGNREECEVAVGETDPHERPTPCWSAASSWRSSSRAQGGAGRDPRRAGRGAAVPGRGRQRPRRRRRLRRRARATDCSAGWDLRRDLEFANVAGAIVASRLECSTAMPTEAEVDEPSLRASSAARRRSAMTDATSALGRRPDRDPGARARTRSPRPGRAAAPPARR